MKKIILSTVVAATVLSMGSAFAGGGSLFGGSGESSMADGTFYGGGSVGRATHACVDTVYDDYTDTMKKTGDDCKTTGWKIFGGYKFTENMAVEAGYYNLGENEGKHTQEGYKAGTNTGEASGVGVAGVYSQPIAENIEVFGKLGAMFWNMKGESSSDYSEKVVTSEEDGTSVLFGLGANYKLSDNWGIRGEWERYTVEYEGDPTDKTKSSEEDIDILSAGVTFSTY